MRVLQALTAQLREPPFQTASHALLEHTPLQRELAVPLFVRTVPRVIFAPPTHLLQSPARLTPTIQTATAFQLGPVRLAPMALFPFRVLRTVTRLLAAAAQRGPI